MDSIHVNSHSLRIAINDDPQRVLAFNPNDAGFAQRFYSLVDRLEEERKKLNDWAQEFHSQLTDAADPVAMGQQVNAKELEVLHLLRDELDAVFGAGTSQMVFGDTMDMDVVCQLFEGLTPFVRKARAERMAQYQRKNGQGVL